MKKILILGVIALSLAHAQVGVRIVDSSGAEITNSTTHTLPVQNTGAAASGSAVSGNPVLVAGSDGTNARTAATDQTGAVAIGDNVAGADAVANANAVVPAFKNGTGSANTFMPVGPMLFNGSTMDRQAYCAGTAPTTINPTTATTTLLLAAVSAKIHHVCMIEVSDVGGATAQTVKITDGTQTTNPCDTGATTLSPTYQFVANATQLNLTIGSGMGVYLQGAAANHQLCVVTSGAVSVFVTVHYTDY